MRRPEDLCTRHLQRIFITLLFNYQRSISLLKARKHVNNSLHALQRLTVSSESSTEPPSLFFPASDNGGGERDRTDGLLRARQALSQLSYTPENRKTDIKRQRTIHYGALRLIILSSVL
jgi:hypothetical protein